MSMSFDWPLALLLLPLPLLWLAVKQTRIESGGPRIPDELATTLTLDHVDPTWPTRLRKVLMWCAWIGLVVAIAQPKLPLGTTVQAFTGRDLMMVMDLSGSMEKKDFQFNGEKVSRLDVVKQVAGDFVQQREGDRVGLILFADDAFVASPLTFDVLSIRHYLGEAQIGLAGRSTALGDAIGLGLRRLKDSASASRVMVLLTDGSNNAGDVEPGNAAQLADELGIRIHTIALGADTMTVRRFGEDTVVNPSLDLDPETLKQVAERSGGNFYRARTTPDLQKIYADIDKLETSDFSSPPFVPQKDIRIVPAAVALLAMFSLGIWHGRWSRRTA